MNILVLLNISIGLLTVSQGVLIYLFLCVSPAFTTASNQGVAEKNTKSVTLREPLVSNSRAAEAPAPVDVSSPPYACCASLTAGQDADGKQCLRQSQAAAPAPAIAITPPERAPPRLPI